MFALTILCFCAIFGQISSSAIPMWEYLSKDEKMSYLYSMFANQVEDFCEFSNMNNCNHELLKFGLGKLKDMPEDHLDTMDPYQRGAHTLIWGSMMDGHTMMNQQPKRRPTATSKPNSYDDQSFGQEYQSQASAKIETVYRVPPPRGFIVNNPQYTIASGPSQYKTIPSKNSGIYIPRPASFYPQNNYQQQNYYPQQNNYQQQHGNQATRFNQEQDPMDQDPMDQDFDEFVNVPLTGPMVTRVHLDGTPVKDEASQLPQDEDLKQYKMSKARLPNF